MPAVIDIALVIFSVAAISASQWIQSTYPSTLPLKDYDISVGTYNKSIYLVGGNKNRRQLTEYIISEDTFIDHGTSYLLKDVHGYSQYWAQIDHLLYIKDGNSDAIDIFDMKTKTFTADYITNIPVTTSGYACLASSQTQLFVLGGTVNAINDVQLYDLFTSQWLRDVPSMKSTRLNFACIVHPTTNALYAIAGWDSSSTRTSSIETIQIEDIHINTWAYIQPLSQAIGHTRCVAHKNTIYVIGDDVGTTKVHTINVLTNDVTVSPDTTPLALRGVAPIVVVGMIYVFGGYSYDSKETVDTWMSYDLYIPTSLPSQPPSSQSEAPTNNSSTSAPTTPNPTTSIPTIPPITSTPRASDSTSAAPITSSDAPSASFPTGTPSKNPRDFSVAPTETISMSMIDSTAMVTATVTINDSEPTEKSEKKIDFVAIGLVVIIVIVIMIAVPVLFKTIGLRKQSKINVNRVMSGSVPCEENKVVELQEEMNDKEVGIATGEAEHGEESSGHNAVNVSAVLSGSAKKTRGREQETQKVVGIAEARVNESEMHYTCEGSNDVISDKTAARMASVTSQTAKGDAIDDA
eukprot:105883_1